MDRGLIQAPTGERPLGVTRANHFRAPVKQPGSLRASYAQGLRAGGGLAQLESLQGAHLGSVSTQPLVGIRCMRTKSSPHRTGPTGTVEARDVIHALADRTAGWTVCAIHFTLLSTSVEVLRRLSAFICLSSPCRSL